jgi:hypothetical protein
MLPRDDGLHRVFLKVRLPEGFVSLRTPSSATCSKGPIVDDAADGRLIIVKGLGACNPVVLASGV